VYIHYSCGIMLYNITLELILEAVDYKEQK